MSICSKVSTWNFLLSVFIWSAEPNRELQSAELHAFDYYTVELAESVILQVKGVLIVNNIGELFSIKLCGQQVESPFHK